MLKEPQQAVKQTGRELMARMPKPMDMTPELALAVRLQVARVLAV
jgi:hypothetical protein